MNHFNKHIRKLEERIVKHLDYDFLKTIQDKFPSNSAYFLACLSEAIHDEISIEEINTDATFDEVLDFFIRKASIHYQNTNISEAITTA